MSADFWAIKWMWYEKMCLNKSFKVSGLTEPPVVSTMKWTKFNILACFVYKNIQLTDIKEESQQTLTCERLKSRNNYFYCRTIDLNNESKMNRIVSSVKKSTQKSLIIRWTTQKPEQISSLLHQHLLRTNINCFNMEELHKVNMKSAI